MNRLHLTLLSATTAFAMNLHAADTLPTVSVAKTEPQGIANWQPAIGEALAQMVITELSKLENLTVLESVALPDIREEITLGTDGEVNQEESVKKGNFRAADYTLKTIVTRFGAKTSKNGGSGWIPAGIPGPFNALGRATATVGSYEYEVQIDWRFIDNNNRQVMRGGTGRAAGKQTGKSFSFSTWQGGGFSDNQEFMDSGLGKATMLALNQMMADIRNVDLKPSSKVGQQVSAGQKAMAAKRSIVGSVLLVDGREIWTNLGSTNGFASGEILKVYEPVVKTNSLGQVVATKYVHSGQIALSRVQKGKSTGEYKGDGRIREGWAVVGEEVEIEKVVD